MISNRCQEGCYCPFVNVHIVISNPGISHVSMLEIFHRDKPHKTDCKEQDPLTPVGKITPSPTSPSHPSRYSVFCFLHCLRFYTLLWWFVDRLSPPHQNEVEVRSGILSTIIWSMQRSEPCTKHTLKYLSSHESGSHLSLAAPWPSMI